MDKINNISFTGIKNIADVGYQRSKNSISAVLSMTLTDDLAGKDLTEFKTVASRVAQKSKNFVHKDGREFLNIENYLGSDGNKIFLNGKEVEINDQNLPIFTYLAKLTRKIANMKNKDMIVNEDYKKYEASSKLIYGTEIDELGIKSLDEPDFYDRFFNKDIVKYCAKETNKLIQKMMEKYLGIN